MTSTSKSTKNREGEEKKEEESVAGKLDAALTGVVELEAGLHLARRRHSIRREGPKVSASRTDAGELSSFAPNDKTQQEGIGKFGPVLCAIRAGRTLAAESEALPSIPLVPGGIGAAMEEQFILRVPPSVAERIERLMNESAAASSSNPDDASLDLSFSEDGRNGTFMIGNESFPASLLDLPAVVESYKTYDDSVLIKTADIGQAELVNQVEKHLISIMHGVSVSILLVDQNASVIGGEEGGDRKKPPVARAPKRPDAQEPAANGDEAEPERSDSDDSEN
nr:unnamed protein product [Digitaria exilis]